MALKFFFLTLLIALSAQAYNAEKHFETRGLGEEIQTLVEKAMELVNTTVDSLKQIAKSLYDSLQEQAKEEVRKVLESLLVIKKQALEAFQEIFEKAAGMGEEAKTCIVLKKDEITDLLNFAQRETLICVKTAEIEIKKNIVKVEDVVEESYKTITGLLKDFKACEKILCQVGVVTKGISAVTEIKSNVENVLKEARVVVKTEVAAMTKCSSEVGETYLREAKIMIEQISYCLNGIEA